MSSHSSSLALFVKFFEDSKRNKGNRNPSQVKTNESPSLHSLDLSFLLCIHLMFRSFFTLILSRIILHLIQSPTSRLPQRMFYNHSPRNPKRRKHAGSNPLDRSSLLRRNPITVYIIFVCVLLYARCPILTTLSSYCCPTTLVCLNRIDFFVLQACLRCFHPPCHLSHIVLCLFKLSRQLHHLFAFFLVFLGGFLHLDLILEISQHIRIQSQVFAVVSLSKAASCRFAVVAGTGDVGAIRRMYPPPTRFIIDGRLLCC
ncbi:unnamed protein product [Albugo candida]|uniref:Uncharacterized protein n=1 Tax=Albugo candida TaxID=65357 RepID=A0A024G8V7_9STRA|nr:unnamed protein product [Albugo candida]|eukprot:CCI42955.1 unnamed protein product [Albugo candida]